MSQETQIIDMTPTWSQVLVAILAAITDGNAEGKRIAREELKRMADAADKHNALVKEHIELEAKVAKLRGMCSSLYDCLNDEGVSMALAHAIEEGDWNKV